MLRPDEARRPWTVSELAQQIRQELRPLSNVFVKGEVSGLKQSARGHLNFAIKDEAALMDAVIWADTARRIPVLPEDGHQFVFQGRVDFWAQAGRLRLIVERLEFDDVGRLRAQLEMLKQRLDSEGAFDAARKRPIPFLPRRVALVTSPTGAVIHDLQETILDRFPNMAIAVYPAQVQGTASPGSVVAALRHCNLDGDSDVVVIARGGGSFEELYAFNTEPVARAILASRIPVVTALGHTSDRTVADMVADAECRTPTEAGARVVPRRADLEAHLAQRAARLKREVTLRVRSESEGLSARERRLVAAASAALRKRLERVGRCREELARLSPERQMVRRAAELEERARRVRAAGVRALRERVAGLERRRAGERTARLLAERMRSAQRAIDHRRERLAALSPDGVLARGYSITQDAATGRVLRASSETAPGRSIRVRLGKGRLGATVEDVS